MKTTSVLPPPSSNHPLINWLRLWRRQGYYFRPVAIATLVCGLYIHLTRVIFGDDLLLQYLVTPRFDKVLTLVIVYAVVAGVLSWRQIAFRSTMHRIGYGLGWFYLAISVPVHIWTAYIQNSTEYLRAFPLWWTYVLFLLMPALILLFWRLRYTEQRVTRGDSLPQDQGSRSNGESGLYE